MLVEHKQWSGEASSRAHCWDNSQRCPPPPPYLFMSRCFSWNFRKLFRNFGISLEHWLYKVVIGSESKTLERPLNTSGPINFKQISSIFGQCNNTTPSLRYPWSTIKIWTQISSSMLFSVTWGQTTWHPSMSRGNANNDRGCHVRHAEEKELAFYVRTGDVFRCFFHIPAHRLLRCVCLKRYFPQML